MVEIAQSADKSFAYILGVYLGDGCVTYTGNVETKTFRLNTIDKDFAEATAEAIYNLVGIKPNIRTYKIKKGRDDNQLGITNADLCHLLTTHTKDKQIIPDYVFTWPRENKLAFISGLMDSEGFVAANSNPTNRRYYMGFKCCAPWVRDFVKVLESVGIMVGKISDCPPYKPHYEVPTRFTIKMQSWINSGCKFNIQRKQSRVDAWSSAGAYENRAKYPRRLISETTRQTPETVMI